MAGNNRDEDEAGLWDELRLALDSEDRLNVLNDAIVAADPDEQTCGAGPTPVEAGEYFSLLTDAVMEPGQAQTWYYRGPPGATVTVALARLANSGGHRHPNSGTGPAGSAVPNSFRLGPTYPQNHPVRITAPEAGGVVVMTSRFSQGTPNVITNTLHVRVPGLMAFGGGPGIVLTGATSTHPTNHYGIPILCNLIAQLGQRYFAQFNRPIFVNDMSLGEGGLFDHQATWRPPHQTHRDGRRVDINSTSMTTEQQLFFRTTALALGFGTVTLETNPPHWHLEL